MTQAKKPALNLLKKLSAKGVVGSIKTFPVETNVEENGEIVSKTVLRAKTEILFRVAGKISKRRIVKTAFGDSVAFVGDFMAERASDNALFSAPELFLPDVAASYLVSLCDQFKIGDPDSVATLDIGFEVGSKPAANSFGYEYTVSPRGVEKIESNALTLLHNFFGDNSPLLEYTPNAETVDMETGELITPAETGEVIAPESDTPADSGDQEKPKQKSKK